MSIGERHRDGHYIWILSRGKPVEFAPDGSVTRIIGTDTDITSLKEAEAIAAKEKEKTYQQHVATLEKARAATDAAHRRAEQLARHDALTGLPNRRVFSETLEDAVFTVQDRAIRYAVMIVDLDRFKPINDINGHAVGDHVLCEVAKRLERLTPSGDMVARLGGDEFGLIVEISNEAQQMERLSAFAHEIITSLEAPINLDGANH